MLEHQKLVLQNLSNNKELFRKELEKSIVWLKSYEVYKLYAWVKEKYGKSHKEIINEVFTLITA